MVIRFRSAPPDMTGSIGWNIIASSSKKRTYVHSHSIIANLKYMLYRVILLLLFQEVPCRANHFVIGRGDYKMRFLLPFHLICDYSLATTPIFTKGSGHRWFSTGAHAVSDTAIGGCKPCALGGFLPDFCQERKAETFFLWEKHSFYGIIGQ